MGLLVAPEPEEPEPPPVEPPEEEPPPAEVPPPEEEPPPEPPLPEPPVAPLAPLPEGSSEAPPDSLAPLASDDPLPVLLDEVFVEVLDTDDACASFSADVLVGGVMFGVLLGMASEAFELPPHAPSVRAQRVRTLTPSAARVAREAALVLKAAPCAARRSGSR